MAPSDESFYHIPLTFYEAFHACVRTVAHPAINPQFQGLLLSRVTVIYPLNDPLYAYPGLYLIHVQIPG
jgi:hypothetical protein